MICKNHSFLFIRFFELLNIVKLIGKKEDIFRKNGMNHCRRKLQSGGSAMNDYGKITLEILSNLFDGFLPPSWSSVITSMCKISSLGKKASMLGYP